MRRSCWVTRNDKRPEPTLIPWQAPESGIALKRSNDDRLPTLIGLDLPQHCFIFGDLPKIFESETILDAFPQIAPVQVDALAQLVTAIFHPESILLRVRACHDLGQSALHSDAARRRTRFGDRDRNPHHRLDPDEGVPHLSDARRVFGQHL